MIQNSFARHLNNRVRRVIGEELALIRQKLGRGKPLRIAVGKVVSFKPLITFATSCGPGR